MQLILIEIAAAAAIQSTSQDRIYLPDLARQRLESLCWNVIHLLGRSQLHTLSCVFLKLSIHSNAASSFDLNVIPLLGRSN